MDSKNSTFYVIDTSSFIEMGKYYPLSNFISFWENLEEILYDGRIAAPKAVFTELERQSDDISEWAKKHKDKLFFDEPNHYIGAQKILKNYPKLVNSNDTRDSADPYVIAMALDRINNPQQTLFCHDVCVITEEIKNKHNKKTKIPHVCDGYDIPCFSMTHIVLNENWKF